METKISIAIKYFEKLDQPMKQFKYPKNKIYFLLEIIRYLFGTAVIYINIQELYLRNSILKLV